MAKGHIHLKVTLVIKIGDFGGCARRAHKFVCRRLKSFRAHAPILVKAILSQPYRRLKDQAECSLIMIGLRIDEALRSQLIIRVSQLLKSLIAALGSLILVETLGSFLRLNAEYRAALLAAIYRDVRNFLP